MFFFFLAQAAGEEYKNLAIHPDLQRSLVNPFDSSLLNEAGNYFWPFDSSVVNIGILLLFVAAFLFWCSYRVNKSYVYHILAWSAAILGLDFLLGFRTPFPSMMSTLTAAVVLLALFIDLTVILTVVALRYLPYFGVEERMLTNIKDGSVTNGTMIATSVVSLLLSVFCLSPCRAYIVALFNHSVWLLWFMALLLVPLGALVARELLPWTILKEHPIPGGGYLKEITNIFIKDGDAQRSEIFGACLSLCVIFISSVWLFKGEITSTDIFGIICIGFLCAVMVRAELNKSIKEDKTPVVEVKRRKDAWS